MDDDAAATARRMRALFEPVHVVSYLTPEARVIASFFPNPVGVPPPETGHAPAA